MHRTYKAITTAGAILALVAFLAFTARAEDATLKDLVDHAAQSRSSIKSYELRLRDKNRTDPAGKRYQNSTVAVWFNESHHRADVTITESTINPDLVGRREVTCRNCVRDGHTLNFIAGVTSVTFSPVGKRSSGQSGLADYRTLGYSLRVPNGLETIDLREKLQPVRNSDHKVIREVVDGVTHVVLQSKVIQSGATTRVWLRPDQGHNVVRIEVSGTVPNTHTKWVYECRSELQQDSGSGVWFPRWYKTYQQVGDVRECDYEAVVEHARFNHTIPRDVFTLPGLDLPEGIAVALPELKRDSDAPLWKSGRLDPVETSGTHMRESYDRAPPPPTPVTSSGDVRWWYATAAAAFGGLAILLLVQRYRRTRPA